MGGVNHHPYCSEDAQGLVEVSPSLTPNLFKSIKYNQEFLDPSSMLCLFPRQ